MVSNIGPGTIGAPRLLLRDLEADADPGPRHAIRQIHVADVEPCDSRRAAARFRGQGDDDVIADVTVQRDLHIADCPWTAPG